MTDNNMDITADDIVGILIHNANQAASHLAVNGVRTDWAAFHRHLTRMQDLTARVHSLVHSTQNGAAPGDEDAMTGAPN